jgi:hypothetical protein
MQPDELSAALPKADEADDADRDSKPCKVGGSVNGSRAGAVIVKPMHPFMSFPGWAR